MKLINIFFFLSPILMIGQNINVNNDFNNQLIRYYILDSEIETDLSYNIRPLNYNYFSEKIGDQYRTIFKNKSNSIEIKTLGIDYFIEYNSHHPYNRNNGTMIPNRGYQHIISPGIFIKTGPLTIQLKPEHHFSENKEFDGFWEGHYPVIWSRRYATLWNKIDMPERFGLKNHNRITWGQSSIRLNWKNISLGISNENLWWGPAMRNSIMMSNNAEGFKHITFNSTKPLNTKIGKFEWQLVSGILESSGYTPPNPDYEYAGTKLYVPKKNFRGNYNDSRYLQALIISYSPSFLDDLSLGFIRWAQVYSDLLRNDNWWLNGSPTYFLVFKNLFRSNDKYVDYEKQTNQAAGVFMRWMWEDSKSEIYFEYYLNDSKQNLRDLILDTDHSRASTIGLQKIFKVKGSKLLFNWEWTQMEQTASRLIRNATSWYAHNYVRDGFTNRGEVLGSSIGPGSNSHYISISKIKDDKIIGLGLEIIDNDNDFFQRAFASAKDFRRYWKDINLNLNYSKIYKDFQISSNFLYSRSLNYQWELDDFAEPYYHPGRDVNNFHWSLKFTYFGSW